MTMTNKMMFKKQDINQKRYINQRPKRFVYRKKPKVNPSKVKYCGRQLSNEAFSESRRNKPTDWYAKERKAWRRKHLTKESDFEKHKRYVKDMLGKKSDIIYLGYDDERFF